MLSISCMEYMGLNGPGIDFACNGASEGCAARCRVQLLEWRVRSGAGWWCCCKVLLQGAAVKVVCALWSWHVGAMQDATAGCRSRIFLRSSRRRSVARGEWLQRKRFMLTKRKFWSCKCTKVQNWEVWGMIRVWFGYDSGYGSGTHVFLEFRKLCCLSLFFPPSTYHNCYLIADNTASSQPRSQPAATSQPYSQPPNQQQQLP